MPARLGIIYFVSGIKAHFHSRKISTDKKIFQKYHCLKLKIFNFNIFSDGKFVSANHILQNFLSTEYFPESLILRYEYYCLVRETALQIEICFIKFKLHGVVE